MNIFAIPPLITAIILSIIGLFVFFNNRKAMVNIIFALFCFSMVWWLIGYTLMYLSKQPSGALFWARIGFMGIIFIPILAYHFIAVFLGLKTTFILCILYFMSIPALILSRAPYVYKDIKEHFWGYYPVAGKYYIIFLLMFGVLFMYGVWVLFRSQRSENIPNLKKHQIRYVLLAFGIGSFGIVDYLVKYTFFNIYPFGYVCALLFIGTIAYSIVRHQLMNIEVIIKKTLVFASLFAIAFGIFVGITVLTQELIVGGRLLGLAISSIIIIFAVRPLEDFLTRTTDKYLFQKKYGYKQVLKSFIDEVITVLNLDKIIQSTIELLDKTLHPETSAILLLNRYEDRYISYETSGHNRDIVLENSSKIVTLLKATKDIFSTEKSESPINVTEELKGAMEILRARLAIPLMLHNDLIGIMLLGKKKSDEEYTKEDLDILTDLARTEAIAIGNAELFAEAAQNERRAAIGTLAAGINHEVGNPLNIINTKVQVYLMSLERGLYKDKKPEDIIKESKDVMNSCLQQTSRISDITKKLSNFAKPSKEFKPELTDLDEQIDETLSVIGHELELERIEIKKSIQKPLSKISADKRQIQQVFFNIIKNAAQAIKGKGTVEIKAYASQEGNVKNVKIEISDTGQGIPEDKLEKIYDPFFTTKEPGEGTGLGLSIVRQLVWRNRGDINVKSKVGEGTMFTLTFPEAL